VVFPEGKQKEFLRIVKKYSKLTWVELGNKINVNGGTLKAAYQFEKCSLPYAVLKNIISFQGTTEEAINTEYGAEIIESITGKGHYGISRVKLPEVDITFDKKPEKLDTSQVNFSACDIKKKNLKLPTKLTPSLAEEIGAHLGDGFLSGDKYEYRLKGNKNEKKYYDQFVKKTFKELYNIDLNIKEYETTYGFELCSKGLWEFKNKVLGIPAGRKNDIRIPEVIKVNNQEILCSFIKGLFDTDGCVSFLDYKTHGNHYPVISFSSRSKFLVQETGEILNMLGLKPTFSDDKKYYYIYLYGYKRLEIYTKMIGWSNSKHTDKVIQWKQNYPELGMNIKIKRDNSKPFIGPLFKDIIMQRADCLHQED